MEKFNLIESCTNYLVYNLNINIKNTIKNEALRKAIIIFERNKKIEFYSKNENWYE